jgi:hypothetical protein
MPTPKKPESPEEHNDRLRDQFAAYIEPKWQKGEVECQVCGTRGWTIGDVLDLATLYPDVHGDRYHDVSSLL